MNRTYGSLYYDPIRDEIYEGPMYFAKDLNKLFMLGENNKKLRLRDISKTWIPSWFAYLGKVN